MYQLVYCMFNIIWKGISGIVKSINSFDEKKKLKHFVKSGILYQYFCEFDVSVFKWWINNFVLLDCSFGYSKTKKKYTLHTQTQTKSSLSNQISWKSRTNLI